jgi:uncharacterized protein
VTVVSDTSPLRYLIAVSRPELIGQIFDRIVIPRAVELELTHPSTPKAVQQWMEQRPAWLETRTVSSLDTELDRILDRGEAEAIQLAIDSRADLLLMDERRGRDLAARRGLAVVGVLGILLESYRRRLIDNPLEILDQLRACRFHASRRLVAEFEGQVQRLAESRSAPRGPLP